MARAVKIEQDAYCPRIVLDDNVLKLLLTHVNMAKIYPDFKSSGKIAKQLIDDYIKISHENNICKNNFVPIGKFKREAETSRLYIKVLDNIKAKIEKYESTGDDDLRKRYVFLLDLLQP